MIYYPAKYENVIAVSATDILDNQTYFTSFSDQIELAASGVSINSTLPSGKYGEFSGTSMATPHVTRAAALVIALGITGSSIVRDRLDATAEDLGQAEKDQYYGYGLWDAEVAASSPVPIGIISGTVANESGGPIADAIVTAGEHSTTTLSGGSYTLADLPIGNYNVAVSAAGFSDAFQTVAVEQDTTKVVDFALIPLLENENDMYVQSIVLSAKHAGPNTFLFVDVYIAWDSNMNDSADESDLFVAGATVELTLSNADQGDWLFSGVTDNNGLVHFMLKKAPEGEYVVEVNNLTHSSYSWSQSLDTQGIPYPMSY